MKPLIQLSPQERHAKLQEMGLDDNMVPLTATDAERQAAQTVEIHVETKPMLSDKNIAIFGTLGTLLGLAAAVCSGVAALPAWLPFLLSAFGAIAMHLAGRSLPALKIGDKPLAPEKFIPILKASAAALGTFASTFAPGIVQGALLLTAAIVYGLAGVVAPQEVVAK